MHRTWVVIALVLCTALVGCTATPDMEYRSALPGEATRTLGVSETTPTPVAFKAAPKSDTPIASESRGSGVTGGGSSTGGGVRATGQIVPSSPDSSGGVKLTVKVTNASGAPVSGAKISATFGYSQQMSDNKSSQTYTCASSSSGYGSLTADATPFNAPTWVQVSIKVTVGGQSYFFLGPSYSTS